MAQINDLKYSIITTDTTPIAAVMAAVISPFDWEESSSSLSSSEDSDSDCDEIRVLYAILMVGETRGAFESGKLTDYVERVVPGLTAQAFKENFRMYPDTFELVLRTIGPALNIALASAGRQRIPADKQLLLTLWFLATPVSYRSVCGRFGVGKATAFRAVRRVTYALHCVAPQVIRWPRGKEANRVIVGFQQAKKISDFFWRAKPQGAASTLST